MYLCAAMMNVEELRDYCLSLGTDVEERLPFVKFKGGDTVLVFYVCGHMFCYFYIEHLEVITIKCQPDLIPELKESHEWITKPYNASPKHWIGLQMPQADAHLTQELIRNSYEIVKKKYGG